jgi:hypothetical protein
VLNEHGDIGHSEFPPLVAAAIATEVLGRLVEPAQQLAALHTVESHMIVKGIDHRYSPRNPAVSRRISVRSSTVIRATEGPAAFAAAVLT